MKNMCGNPLCLEYSMKVFNTKNFKNAITCDNPSCFKSGEQLKKISSGGFSGFFFNTERVLNLRLQ